MDLDVDRLRREVTRHVRSETVTDPLELARYPDFEFEPMPFDAWLKDATMLGLSPLSDIQREAALIAERILFEPTFDALRWPKYPSKFDISLAWGKGSGKDYLSRIMLSRAIYLLSSLASPQAYFGMPGSEQIVVTNIATSAPQAKHVFFTPWVQMLSRSSFYRGMMDPKANYIVFDKGLRAFSGHSSVESQEGQNLMMAILDEIAAFKTSAELASKRKQQDREPAQSAEGVYNMAKSSIRSRFPMTGKLVSISFTRFKNDMIDLLVKKAYLENDQLGEESRRYGSRAATWEVNPLRKQSDFDDDYADDPMQAQCRYECRPVASPHRFFKNLLAVKQALGVPLDTLEPEKLQPVPSLGIEYYWGPDPGNPKAKDGWQVRFDFTHLLHHNAPLAIHLDLGISQDLAGVSASHFGGFTDFKESFSDLKTGIVEETVVRKMNVITDFVVVFEQVRGDPLDGTPDSDIQVRWIRQLVLELINRGWRVGLFTADGYQSTDTFQLLQQMGVTAELYSLDRKTEGFDILKNLIYEGNITAPFHPLLYTELESLVKMTETKIDHQAGMSKDMADSWAGSARGVVKLMEEGQIGGDVDGWTGASIDEMSGRYDEPVRHTDVDVGVRPRYAHGTDGDGDFWSGGATAAGGREPGHWDRK